jgi:predicted lipoprotein with Yx(FWY)xxD motif
MRMNRKIAYAAVALAGLAAASIAFAGTRQVVRTAHNNTLGATILVNLRGRTLYHLSVEKNGRFVCTGACVATWRPLVVPAGTKPTGAARLGTIKRPEGKLQVTYRGLPLYTFANDARPGDVKGEGLKDVGVWHAAVVGTAPATSTTTTTTGGYGGGYPGGYGG